MPWTAYRDEAPCPRTPRSRCRPWHRRSRRGPQISIDAGVAPRARRPTPIVNIWSKWSRAVHCAARWPQSPRSADPLAPFSPAVRDWFRASFEAPTDAQARGWAAISSGEHTLIHAPTGSGKTLAAFLWTLDRLATHPSPHADPRNARRRPRPLHLAAQGADLRHRAQPARPADRDRAGRRATRRTGAEHLGRQPDRRHARPRTGARSPATRRTS